ncbi:MAG: hypothetical protein L3J66_11485 [Bacteroidales bacterium]|nr:hypothetical protein [Bacteroidales bacterium]
MKKEKIILQLGVETDNLKAHIQRLKKDNYRLHPLDVELLQQKTRQLYDMLFELENAIGQKEETVPQSHKPEEKPLIKETAVPEQKAEVMEPEEIEAVVEENEVLEEIPKTPPTEEAAALPETLPKVTRKEESTGDKKPEPLTEKAVPAPEPEVKTQKQTEVKSTLDLFSESTMATVSDKFAGSEEQSLADKMQHSRVTDLRQSIGINEKFLFINELFSGDMGRYNKAVDELNEMTTLKGVQTYFMEIKIQYQWDEGQEAYQKLKDLVERKFK